MSALPTTEPRCLAHTAGSTATRHPDWCEKRGQCARAKAIGRDRFDALPPIKSRVCADGTFDQFVEEQP